MVDGEMNQGDVEVAKANDVRDMGVTAQTKAMLKGTWLADIVAESLGMVRVIAGTKERVHQRDTGKGYAAGPHCCTCGDHGHTIRC